MPAAYSYVVGGIPGTGIRQLFVTGPEGLKLELQCPTRRTDAEPVPVAQQVPWR